jgi:RNA polymerase sigma-70 factor (ECF subfamily)
MPSIGMQRGFGFDDGARRFAGAALTRGRWRAGRVPSWHERDDARAMAPDPEQLALRLARRSDAELLALTPSVPDAFDVFFVRHNQAIVSFLWRQTGSQELAFDLTSETFAVALESVARYDPARGEARGWLFGIAKITLFSSYRQQSAEQAARRRLGMSVTGYSDEMWEEAEARIDAALPGLIDGLDQLPRAERLAVIARILDERDYSEIAASEDATEAAIRQRVKRGLSRLRKQVGRDDG